MAVDPPVNWRELKWHWQLIRSSLNAVDSEVRGPTTGVQRRGLLGDTGSQAQWRHSGPARRYRDRRISLQQHLAGTASRCACSDAASSA